MSISIDDQIHDPDTFLVKALNAKLDSLNQRINELVTTGKNKAELERLLSARADFMEVLRSPRLFLARPPGATVPGLASSPSPAPTAPGAPRAGSSGLPFGAVPQPRRVGAAPPEPGADHGHHAPATHAPPSKPAQTSPPAAATPSAKPGGMLSFLKGVQTQQPGGAAPGRDTVAPPPSAPHAETPTPAPRPAPATPTPPAGTSAGDPPSKGQMLSFLEKVKVAGAAPAGTGAPGAPRSKELTYEGKKALIEKIKAHAASTGFQDIYEMLNFKKEKLIEHRANLLKTTNLPAAQVTALIDREIAEIDDLLMKRPQEIVSQVQEFDEVARVDTGGLAAIRLELKGLLDEIQ